MTKLAWDEAGEKVYETGVDRGVLYVADGSGVPWNGLTAIDEAPNVATTSYYIDGTTYDNDRVVGDFSATLKAFTYPDEFLEFDGYQSAGAGLILDGQPVYDLFGLSYRTNVGNDLLGNDFGYKIHILYDLTATPSNRNYDTNNDSVNPLEFSWVINGIPTALSGFRPTCHAIIDSRVIDPALLLTIESILYGGVGLDAHIPTLAELVDIVSSLTYGVYDLGDGTWVIEGPPDTFTSLDAVSFSIDETLTPITDGFIIETTYP